MTRLTFDFAALDAALRRAGRRIDAGFRRIVDALGNLPARLAELRRAVLTERARKEAARQAYLRRTAVPRWTRSTSPAFRAGTRRTKQAASTMRRRQHAH